jgi:hypothetical protein
MQRPWVATAGALRLSEVFFEVFYNERAASLIHSRRAATIFML